MPPARPGFGITVAAGLQAVADADTIVVPGFRRGAAPSGSRPARRPAPPSRDSLRRAGLASAPSTVCVIDQILTHYADRVTDASTRAPVVQALLTTAWLSANRNDFALMAMLGLLGLRIFEACGANIADLVEVSDVLDSQPDRRGSEQGAWRPVGGGEA
jgi:hypothetical protein